MGLPSNITKIYHCCISFSWSLVWIFTESCILNLGSYYFFHSLWIRPLKWVSRLKVWIWLAVVNIENSQHFQLLTKIFSDWLLQFLIIICSIFVQSSDWLVATAISHYYLLNFRSKLWLASQQMTWPKFILKSCKRLRELSPEHDSSLLTQLSFCDINKGPWYKFSLLI